MVDHPDLDVPAVARHELLHDDGILPPAGRECLDLLHVVYLDHQVSAPAVATLQHEGQGDADEEFRVSQQALQGRKTPGAGPRQPDRAHPLGHQGAILAGRRRCPGVDDQGAALLQSARDLQGLRRV